MTVERIASLAATTGTEPLTVDFKEKAGPRLAECVASMANAYGGLVLVGITDSDRTIVGVKTETLAHVADMLATRLRVRSNFSLLARSFSRPRSICLPSA